MSAGFLNDAFVSGARAALLVSVFTHGQQDASVRVSPIDESGSDWSAGKNRRARGNYVFAHHGDHSALPAHHGERLRVE